MKDIIRGVEMKNKTMRVKELFDEEIASRVGVDLSK